MTSSKEAGQWRYFSSLLADARDDDEREQRGHYLLNQIASGAIPTGHYRYFWANDAARLSDTGAPRTGHRKDRLPDAFWRLGRFMNAWQFSAVTFGERSIIELEIFFPDVVAGDQVASPRKSSAPLVAEEAERRRIAGLIPSGMLKKDFAGELASWLKHEHSRDMKPKSVENAISTVWEKHKHFSKAS
jgi:hypothetical protein